MTASAVIEVMEEEKKSKSGAATTQQLEQLETMKAQYTDLALRYQKIERTWRTIMFRLAIAMGVMPIISGSAQLLPDFIQAWFAFGISLFNVMIVIVNTKLDMGERVADASMAGKGYEKLATEFDFLITEAKMGKDIDIETKMVSCKCIIDTISSNISYPERPPQPGCLASICAFFRAAHNAKDEATKLTKVSKMKPEDWQDAVASNVQRESQALKGAASAAQQSGLSQMQQQQDAFMGAASEAQRSGLSQMQQQQDSLKGAASAGQQAWADLPAQPSTSLPPSKPKTSAPPQKFDPEELDP